nr:hypothetical protein [Anaerolineae bacterium]
MTDPIQLDIFYRGVLVDQAVIRSDYIITAASTGLSEAKAQELFNSMFLGTHTLVNLSTFTNSYGLFQVDTYTYVLGLAKLAPRMNRGHPYPDYYGIRLPVDILRRFGGDVMALVQIAGNPSREFPVFAQRDYALEPARLTEAISRPGPADHVASLEKMSGLALFSNQQALKTLLGGILTGGVCIAGAPSAVNERLALVRGVVALLPEPMRPFLTFATAVFDPLKCRAALKFLFEDTLPAGDEPLLNWDGTVIQATELDNDYVNRIVEAWVQGSEGVLRVGQAVSACLPRQINALDGQAARYALMDADLQQRFDPDTAFKRLSAPAPVPDERAMTYCVRLLEWAGKNKRIDYTEVLLKRQYFDRYPDKLRPVLVSLAREGYGEFVHDLLHQYLIRYNGDFSVWAPYYIRLGFDHLGYLLAKDTAAAGRFMKKLRDNCIAGAIADAWCRWLEESDTAEMVGWMRVSPAAQVELVNLHNLLGLSQDAIHALKAMTENRSPEELSGVVAALSAFDPTLVRNSMDIYTRWLPDMYAPAGGLIHQRIYEYFGDLFGTAATVAGYWLKGDITPGFSTVLRLLSDLQDSAQFIPLLDRALELVRQTGDPQQKVQMIHALDDLLYIPPSGPASVLIENFGHNSLLTVLLEAEGGERFLDALKQSQEALSEYRDEDYDRFEQQVIALFDTLGDNERAALQEYLEALANRIERLINGSEFKRHTRPLGRLFSMDDRGSQQMSLVELLRWLSSLLNEDAY